MIKFNSFFARDKVSLPQHPIRIVTTKFISDQVSLEVSENTSNLVFRKYDIQSQHYIEIPINPYAALAINSFEGPKISKEVYKIMLECGQLIYAYRYTGENTGLVMCESFYQKPNSIGHGWVDVTSVDKFREYNLARNPFMNWKHEL